MITLGKRTYNDLREDDLVNSIITLSDMAETASDHDKHAIILAVDVMQAVWDTYFGIDEVTM